MYERLTREVPLQRRSGEEAAKNLEIFRRQAMSRHSTCSDSKVLQRFVLGTLSADDVESLAQHVADCPQCVATLHNLKEEDTLTSAVRQAAQATPPNPADAKQAQMIEQLSQHMSRLAMSHPASRPVGHVSNVPVPDVSRSAVLDGDSASRTLHLDEEARRHFEADWRAGKAAAIESYLPAEDAPQYLATLEELIHIDMEFRWRNWNDATNKAARPLRVESYLDRFSKLNVSDIVRRLVEQEFRLRRRYEDEATPEEYQERFPGLALFGLETMHDFRGFLAPAAGPNELGRLGNYRVLRVLGAGGMGIVYQAEDLQLQRPVVLKVMKPELASQPEAHQRFLREARAIASFNHDHIVAVFQVGEDRGMPFLTMPLLAGETLDARLKRDRRLSIDLVVQIGREICEGLAAAHARGIIHRDIKPANVWLETRGQESGIRSQESDKRPAERLAVSCTAPRVKIMDFGLARPVEGDARLTQSGMIVGSPAYMAPEQARGETVDGRADLFSLGCVLYRACTGRLPFEARDAMSTLLAVAMDSPAPPSQLRPEVPSRLSDLIMKLLAKSPADRPASAGEVAEALQAMLPLAGGAEQTLVAQARTTVPTKRKRWPLVAAAAGLAALAVPLFFAPTILRFATNQGDLIAEIDDENVEVVLKQGDLIVRPRSKEREFVIKAGKGVLEVFRPGEKEALLMKDFELARGGKTIVTVKLAELAKAAPKKQPDKPAPEIIRDKEEPFVVLRKGGGRDAFATLESAFDKLGGDSVVEIHGNGPFHVRNTLMLKDKTLMLRAAKGYRPQIHAPWKAHSPLFQLDGVRLGVEGCDFRGPFVNGFVNGTGPAWEFDNCRILSIPGKGEPLLSYQGQRLRFTNCLISYPSDWNHGNWLRIAPGKLELDMSNCILVAGGRSILPAGPDCDWKINLQNNTVFHSGAILPELDKVKARLDVRATGNIFQLNSSNGNTYANPLVSAWKDKIRWEGSYNLYVGPKEGLALVHDPEGKKRTYGLAGWEEYWGKKEQGSADAPRFFPAWRELYHAKSPEALLAAARALVGGQTAPRSGKRAGVGPVIGPDWDVVGPGAGYARALAAAGRPVAKLRPEPPIAGLPFLVVRNDKVLRAFEHLREAVAFAKSGDVIELRTDGPLPGEDLQSDAHIKRITIRAAPGYTPIIRGYWRYSWLTLSIEGLHFENGGLHGPFKDYATVLARVTNCTFSAGEGDDGWPIGPGGPPEFLRTPPDGPLEIVNSVIPGRISPYIQTGSHIVVRNSLVGWFYAHRDPSKALFDIDRSVLWQPLNFFGPNAGFVVDDIGRGADRKLEVRNSLLENGTQLIWTTDKNVFIWLGQGNVYRLGEQAWCSQTPDGSPPPTSLLRWQALWNSDHDSIRIDTKVYDPRQWKLLPGSPGYQQGPAGADLGADVRRIGTVALPVPAK